MKAPKPKSEIGTSWRFLPPKWSLFFGTLLASTTLLFTIASTASALPERFFGMIGQSSFDSESDWEVLQKAGVQRVRMQIKWHTINVAGGGGSFGWKNEWAWQDTYDRYFEKAAKHGIEILPYLYTRKDDSQAYYRVSDAAYPEWLQFVWTVVQRYGDAGTFWQKHGSLPQYPVHFWEVWNEPNLTENCPFTGCNGKEYGEFLVGTSKTIHEAQKAIYADTAKVLFGGIYQDRWDVKVNDCVNYWCITNYLNNVAKAPGITGAYDGLSIHPYAIGRDTEAPHSYSERAAGVPSNISAAYNAQVGAGLGAKPLWITEVGWPVDEGLGAQPVDEGEQAGLVNEVFNWTKTNWATYNIQYVAWYALDEVDDPKWAYHSGLRDVDGDFRQAWYSYQAQAGAPKWPASYNYMLGTGNGSTFSWGWTNLKGFYLPVRMAVGDITGDSKADIVSVEREVTGNYYVYVRGIGNGSGSFSWAGTGLKGMYPALKMDVGDITGDGKADIVAVEKEASGLYVYARGISNGAGGFSWAGTGLSGMYRPVAMALGDITGDGKADIVAVEKEASGLYVYARAISNGAGGFSWAGTGLSGFHQPVKLSLGDINGDGKADIVAVEKEASGQYVYVRGISNGTGGFAWSGTNLTSMNHAQKMDLGDVNGDGKADIISVEH